MALELLAPARTPEVGRIALACGADAVYVGGPAFGARRSAGNALVEVASLVQEAHRQGAKVYAALNTILFEEELEAARTLAWDLHGVGVDALIVQDLAFLELDLPPLPLHASTQAACDGADKVAFLADSGFQRVILARELSLDEIRAVRRAAPEVELEAFVFGALCVGESGRCGLGQALAGRSGNRGACVQPCRWGWDLDDGSGHRWRTAEPLLSIRDLDATGLLEDLADAGVRSFKVEGRMKDADYVKNAVGHVRRHLDGLLERRPDLGSPSGTTLGFVPDPRQTFNRGFTTYRLDGERRPLLSGAASGWLGTPLGSVEALAGPTITLGDATCLVAGDGLAWAGPGGRVVSATVLAVSGAEVRLDAVHQLSVGQPIYRNRDRRWLEALGQATPSGPPRRLRSSVGLTTRRVVPLPEVHLDHRWNLSNSRSRAFCLRRGAITLEPALELQDSAIGRELARTWLCLRYELGACPHHPHPTIPPPTEPLVEPLTLRSGPHTLVCTFDCVACRMRLQKR